MECTICKTDCKRKWPWTKTCRKEECVKAQGLQRNLDNIKKKNLKLFDIENDFSDKAFAYNDKVIPYPSSLTGRAYVGLAKAPLMKNKSGIGFQGVLMQSENRELIQCSECGEWMKQVTPNHIKMHGMKVLEYKEKYGINIQQGLVSDITKIKRRDKGIRNLANQREQGLSTLIPDAPRGGHRGKKRRMQFKNLKGTCDKQLETKMTNFIHRFKRMPTCGTRSFPSQTMKSRFGSMNKAYRHYGLPIKKAGGRGRTIYTFADHTIFVVRSCDPLEQEILYQIMLDKCPILKK